MPRHARFFVAILALLISCASDPYPDFKNVSLYWSPDWELSVKAYYTSSTDEARIKAHALWVVQKNSPRFVFYFNDLQHTPDITSTGYEFPKEYEPYCIAGFWRYADGREKFVMWPLKN
jgi:hypothetical protein